jgi:hypothetical protein
MFSLQPPRHISTLPHGATTTIPIVFGVSHPITGIAGCCARPPSGHAVAAPM